jgi:quinol-cytochrome oxidoreductase complex cytochrome b subunit
MSQIISSRPANLGHLTRLQPKTAFTRCSTQVADHPLHVAFHGDARRATSLSLGLRRDLFCFLVVQLYSGIILAMHYAPNSALAFDSIEKLMRDTSYGWLMRYTHMVGASLFFFAVYIHLFRGLYYGSYKSPREVLWMIGVAIFLCMMATAFMGYSLVWGQMSFWAVTVITNLFSSFDSIYPGLGAPSWSGSGAGSRWTIRR